jgi:tripartite-type tricarboxylate transporter receptor subunit TctC
MGFHAPQEMARLLGESIDLSRQAQVKATQLLGGPLAINTLLFSKLPYDPKTDITPITQLVTQPSILAVNSSIMVNSDIFHRTG